VIRTFHHYSSAYQHVRVEPTADGVLEVVVHTEGGSYMVPGRGVDGLSTFATNVIRPNIVSL
jgi:hypothetical protein